MRTGSPFGSSTTADFHSVVIFEFTQFLIECGDLVALGRFQPEGVTMTLVSRRPKSDSRPQLLLSIEQDGPEQYKVHGSQLEIVGAKLRGRPHFIVPFTLAALTVLFTAVFQVINWSNSVKVNNATDVAKHALEVSQNVTAAIGRRHYATLTFIPPLRDLIRPNEPPHPGASVLLVPNVRDDSSGPKRNPNVAPVTSSAELWTSRPDHPGTFEKPGPNGGASGGSVARALPPKAVPLAAPVLADDSEGRLQDARARLNEWDTELKKRRFDSYYAHLKQWNEGIDQLLTDVHYALDQPIFLDANGSPQVTHQGFGRYYNQMRGTDENDRSTGTEGIDCKRSLKEKSLTDELTRLGLYPNSLKLRLAGIHFCFMQLNALLDDAKTKRTWSKDLYDDLVRRLGRIREMGNELNCYALHRVDYYEKQKDGAFVSPGSVWRWAFQSRERAAQEHFDQTPGHCSRDNRPT
ncbi:MAG: hypothetical protein HXX10_23965 [Rhodoplanes sp.]|uniref:hypothetical protein n=1 Tax=Rhodoplanes sp. TaxID=1968906 RepID=UPI00179FD111|nr:hypothetical protein [Rhodoplanes sp.]NVO17093.1 hypothetical protein [Rhodoplanes sp.]